MRYEVRTLRIFAIGLVGAVLALTVSFWAKWALLVAAGVPLLFLLVGQFLFPHSKRSIRLWMNSDIVGESTEMRLRLSGKEVTLDFFKRWHDFRIEICNVWLLAAIGLLSLAALAGAYTLSDLPLPGYSYEFIGGPRGSWSAIWLGDGSGKDGLCGRTELPWHPSG